MDTFTPYACSRGTVIAHQDDPPAYIIQTATETIGAPANGTPSPEAVEHDLANPPAQPEDTTAEWEQFLAGSITDPVTGIALKASFKARNDFVGQVTMIREALDAGFLTPETVDSIWDANNVEHSLAVAEIRGILLRYGFQWHQAFKQLAP